MVIYHGHKGKRSPRSNEKLREYLGLLGESHVSNDKHQEAQGNSQWQSKSTWWISIMINSFSVQNHHLFDQQISYRWSPGFQWNSPKC